MQFGLQDRTINFFVEAMRLIRKFSLRYPTRQALGQDLPSRRYRKFYSSRPEGQGRQPPGVNTSSDGIILSTIEFQREE